MKMLRYSAIALLGLGLTFAACKKEKSREGNVKPSTPDSYAPYTVGSSFRYQDVSTLNDTTTYTVTVTGDTTIDGTIYQIMQGSNGVTTYNSYDDQGNYYQIAGHLTYQQYSFGSFKSLYLKSAAPVGSSWNDTVSVDVQGIAQRGKLTYTMEQKAISKIVGDTSYTGVSAVQTSGSLLDLPLPITISLGTNFYASGVGLVETDTQTDTVRLIDYTIVK
ncbi:hypothetical protein DCC81_02395 [Chitinophaga parva]|uniref:Uncharacterized protein n=1 Tax=Chitinophaga parva TaxID=2169414 RepID=A0A2T7BL04_9BACT|nr:hypothetical protein [Chitinophaga parva]PUZ28355.1 hypothetical protein DCC81_02395 [Chitinophaga parva]